MKGSQITSEKIGARNQKWKQNSRKKKKKEKRKESRARTQYTLWLPLMQWCCLWEIVVGDI